MLPTVFLLAVLPLALADFWQDILSSTKQTLSNLSPFSNSQLFKVDSLKTVNAGTIYPEMVSDWVQNQHKIPFCLAISLNAQPFVSLKGWQLDESFGSDRVAVWKEATTGKVFIGCRGTTFKGNSGYGDDIKDNFFIAGLSKYVASDGSQVKQAEQAVKKILQSIPASNIMIGGHSLGGNTAIQIGQLYNISTVAFNGAAPPTNPVLKGPGPELATQYHIAGDLISTHMGSTAAKVIRISKLSGYEIFGFKYMHSAERFLKSDQTIGYIDANTEDQLFQEWAKSLSGPLAIIAGPFVNQSPIPDSQRYSSGSQVSYQSKQSVGVQENQGPRIDQSLIKKALSVLNLTNSSYKSISFSRLFFTAVATFIINL